MNNRVSGLSKLLLWLSATFLIVSLFVPLWRIDLDAPQYPEGLRLLIWPNKIAGDVDIINGLNHYIGMKTLHTADFMEFRLLPFLISAYALLFILAAVKGRKKWLYGVFIAFVLFGIIAMVDFWKWEYDYGHNLDPNAAIRVPGMAYQPPLIGFKQLLNFGAFSMPDIGGWLFVGTGILSLAACFNEWKRAKKRQKGGAYASVAVLLTFMFLSGCGNSKAEPLVLHKDACDYCRMGIADGRFGAEIITEKGRVYKFDDLHCMAGFIREQKSVVKSFYICDYEKDNTLMDATKAYYVQHPSLKSPMGGQSAAFNNPETAKSFAAGLESPVHDWNSILKLMATN